MGLFNFGKKKEEKKCCCSEQVTTKCGCGGTCGISDIEKYRFIVLGACCKKSTETFENAKTAVAQLGLEDEVLNIGDNAQIAKYGVMQTPALVIDNKIVSYGKLLSVDEIKSLIQNTIS